MNDFYFASLPGIDHEELIWLDELTKKFDAETKQRFMILYQNRRRDPQVILITCLLGLVAVAGIHRFLTNQILMGLLYFFTGGLCLVGTIIDAINYRKLAWEYNKQASMDVAAMLGRFDRH
ncbi:TM2 domain-containing protein [Chitinophaga lutea]